MGEALLALLEGRDPKAAVVEYRKREYVPRHLTSHIDDYRDEDGVSRWERVLPSSPSAEDVVMAAEEPVRKVKYHHGANRPIGHVRNRQQQPSMRRRKDAGWRAHI